MNERRQSFPFAYFITFTCYGARLHGHAKGSVDRLHNIFDTPYLKAAPAYEKLRRKQMSQPPYLLNFQRRKVVLQAIQESCQYFDWHLFSAHIRSNHVHAIVGAEIPPKIIMTEFKARSSKALNKIEPELHHRKRWTRHGSTRYIWSSRLLIPAIKYVVEEQGLPMSVYCDPHYDLNGVGDEFFV